MACKWRLVQLMEFIDNLKNKNVSDDWIDSVLQLCLQNEGMHRPREGGKPAGKNGDAEWQRAISAGYSPDAYYFQMFDKENLNIEIPILDHNKNQHWWITKMLPGQFMPMHVDPHTIDNITSERYWIPLQDFSPGHIFMYGTTVISNYKKGDIYRYTNSQELHGAANIGFIPRVVLQITTHM